MSPAKSPININGSRPSPLKIAKDSHLIDKSVVFPPQDAKQKQRQPVIIYAHSPKIIHTKPHDFMALVQKLTGCNARSDDNKTEFTQVKKESKGNNNVGSVEDNDRTVRKSSNSGGFDVNVNSSSISPCFADMQSLFTPNSMSFFCSPNSMSNLITPSAFDFLKGLPEC